MRFDFQDLAGLNAACHVSLAPYSTFRSGGPAAVLLQPDSEEALLAAARRCLERDWPLYVLGQGSNVLISDQGLDGVVLVLAERFTGLRQDGQILAAQSGVSLARLASHAAAGRLSGLEFAAGIPGTLGGAILMNAGAYEHAMAEIVVSTRCLDGRGEVCSVSAQEHNFAYRQSRFSTSNELILGARLQLYPAQTDPYEVMAGYQLKRRSSQPLACLSCGSAFKRPAGHFAGKLISDAGLKGQFWDGAGVSEKHAGFIVNRSAANSEAIARAFCRVQETVFAASGILLEPEVRLAGPFRDRPQKAATLKALFTT